MNDYFCVLPFFGYEFSAFGGTHCCLLPKKYDINQIRNDILNKKRSEFCSACWKLEDAGLISDRKLKNSALDFYWDKDIRYIEEEAINGNFKPLMIKSVTSNTCNSTCVTCGPGPSSAWQALENKSKTIPIYNIQSQSKEELDRKLNYSELISLNFIGGEPLYEKLNFYVLEKLLEHDNANCFIQFTTNGSTSLTQYRKDVLSKFKNININVSIDGIGPVFEYLRYPLKWDDLLDNLKFFRSITENISASYTTSNLNVLYHHDILNWFNKEKINHHYNPVINPSHFRPAALPNKTKHQLFEKFGRTKDLEFFIGSQHTDKDDEDFEYMLKEIKRQDALKQISIKDYLPEFCELIGPF